MNRYANVPTVITIYTQINYYHIGIFFISSHKYEAAKMQTQSY